MTPKLVLGLIVLSLAACVNGIFITHLSGCTKCNVINVMFPSKTEYLLQTGDLNVWYSSDEGKTWTLTLPNVDSYQQFNTDPLSFVFSLKNNTMYYSQDGGKTVTRMQTPFSASSGYSLHSTQRGWILNYLCNKNCLLYYSKNFGSTWKSGPDNLSLRYALWGHDNNNPDLIFAIKSDNSFSFTKNYGVSWTSIIQNSIGFVLTNHYLYVGVLQDRGSARLYSSSSRLDPSHTLPQYYWLDEFPTGNSLPEQGYTFLDDTTRSEFIAVIQNSSTSWGHLYSSDFDGDEFTLSLDFVASQEMYYDFAPFTGLNGMYVTNAYNNATTTNKQTVFSFDNGGEWKLLPAPATDYNSQPTNCDINQGCSLHLHGQLSWYFGTLPHFYTSPNAIGLMVGVGNMGTGLLSDPFKSSTFFTRDAGVTWAQIYPEPTIYEFGDHGGILVFATINAPTDRVHYSLDEGKTIVDEVFTTSPIYVDNIFTEPSGTSRVFVLIGHAGANYYVLGLDFTEDPYLPTCTDDDYESWVPTNGDALNSKCFMGSVTTYKRRKQDSQCYNDRDLDHFISQEPCKCQWEDYECDVGFSASKRNSTDGFTCTSVITRPGCATGYRLIPDTMCQIQGGLDLTSKACPGYSGTPTETSSVTSSSTGSDSKDGGHGGLVAFLVIFFILVGIAGGVGVMYWRNERFREWVLEKVARPRQQGYGRVNQAQDDVDDLEN